MIILKHQHNRVVNITRDNKELEDFKKSEALASIMQELASRYPNDHIVWIASNCEARVNVNFLKQLQLNNKMLSYAVNGSFPVAEELGFVEQSVFFKVKRDVKYPTWIMSAEVGCISCSALSHFARFIPTYADFVLFLNVLAKVGMTKGLKVYSEPRLALYHPAEEAGFSEALGLSYSFLGVVFNVKWIFLFEVQRILYTKEASPLLFLKALLTKRIKASVIPNLTEELPVSEITPIHLTLDVVIPTIGRKDILKQTLLDLAEQTVLPETVLLVEQNPDEDSVSELDYLNQEQWPFEIIHTFIHQTGACNARNLALNQVTSDWVFLADDDLRIPKDFLERSMRFIKLQQPEAFTVSCLQQGEREQLNTVIQWPAFGSGCSFVKASAITKIRFDMAFEHGFGEDADFGMQLRNEGFDVLYNPFLKIIHIKAPSGGFRKPIVKPWEQGEITPKPAPTVLASILKHSNRYQILGYKTLLFLKFYFIQNLKNPISYIRVMQKRWDLSMFWAKKLLKDNL